MNFLGSFFGNLKAFVSTISLENSLKNYPVFYLEMALIKPLKTSLVASVKFGLAISFENSSLVASLIALEISRKFLQEILGEFLWQLFWGFLRKFCLTIWEILR